MLTYAREQAGKNALTSVGTRLLGAGLSAYFGVDPLLSLAVSITEIDADPSFDTYAYGAATAATNIRSGDGRDRYPALATRSTSRKEDCLTCRREVSVRSSRVSPKWIFEHNGIGRY